MHTITQTLGCMFIYKLSEVIKYTLSYFCMCLYLYLWTYSTVRLKVSGPLSPCPWQEGWPCALGDLNLSAPSQKMCENVFNSSPGIALCASSGLSNSLSGIQLMLCVNLRKKERNVGQNILCLVRGISWQNSAVVKMFSILVLLLKKS